MIRPIVPSALLMAVYHEDVDNSTTIYKRLLRPDVTAGGFHIYGNNIYVCDYRDMTLLRQISDKRRLTLLLVHHTRKLKDDAPLNTLSGSTGFVGSVNGVFVLEKDSHGQGSTRS